MLQYAQIKRHGHASGRRSQFSERNGQCSDMAMSWNAWLANGRPILRVQRNRRKFKFFALSEN